MLTNQMMTGKCYHYIVIVLLIVLSSNCVNTLDLGEILIPGQQSILFMEQDLSLEHRKHDNWRIISVHLKSKSISSSTTITFGGSSYPSWFRSIDKCLKWFNYFDTNQVLQLIESNTTIKFIPTETMNQLYSACDLSERIKGSSVNSINRNDQESPLLVNGQLDETDREKVDRLLKEKSKQFKKVLIRFHYNEDDVNSEVKPLEGIIVNILPGIESNLTKSNQSDQLTIDYCRIYDKINVEKYLTINPKTPTINLESRFIEIVSTLCRDTLDLINVQENLFNDLIVGQQLKEINFLEVDNESWKSRGTRNFLIRLHTRSKARPFKWLINKPDYLSQWSLIVDHCDIFSNPDLVDLLTVKETSSTNHNNQLIDRPTIKYLLNTCDYVNIYQ